MSGSPRSLAHLNQRIVDCDACPRLRAHCSKMAQVKRRAYAGEHYWGKPVHGFGDASARILIVGLAPAAHGANRTGRVFTGDRSGDWLYRALHKAGLANQPQSTHAQDGLQLKGAYVTCAVRCAPPDNKPSPQEVRRCSEHLAAELALLKEVEVFIALGRLALDALWPLIASDRPKPKFSHGAIEKLPDGRKLVLSYHPSQQNTFTGRLTEPMFDRIFKLVLY